MKHLLFFFLLFSSAFSFLIVVDSFSHFLFSAGTDSIAYGYVPAYRLEQRNGAKYPGEWLGWINFQDFRNQENEQVVQGFHMVKIYNLDGDTFTPTRLYMSIDAILWEERVGDTLYPMILHHETSGEVITIERSGGNDNIGR